jgi:phosphoribosylamine-glycine ligase
MSKITYVFFTVDGSILPVAEKLIKEGRSVIVGMVDDMKYAHTDKELKSKVEPEKPDKKKLRTSLYDGIIKKYTAEEVIKKMKGLNKKEDYFIFSETNCAFRFMELASKMGFTNGMFATQRDRLLESERVKAKEVVKEFYPDVNVADCQTFEKSEDGIKYIESNPDKSYVLKSNGESGETVVPKNEDPEISRQLIIDMLRSDSKSYEANGFLLEEKIMDGIEMTPQAVFYDGELVFTDVDFETKCLGSGDKGPNLGCSTNLIIATEKDCKLNKIAFPEFVYAVAKKHKGFFVVDCALLFSKDKPYFLEFCFNRCGFDSFPTEITMSGGASAYFEAVIKGKNPLKMKYGCGVRILNITNGEPPKADVLINCDDDDVFLYDCKKVNDEILTVGNQIDTAVATSASDNLDSAINKCYNSADSFGLKDSFYRTKTDFVTKDYPQSIMNRLSYATDKGLI